MAAVHLPEVPNSTLDNCKPNVTMADNTSSVNVTGGSGDVVALVKHYVVDIGIPSVCVMGESPSAPSGRLRGREPGRERGKRERT